MGGGWRRCLACGPDAILSHHAAAALWELRPSPQSRIDVTAPGKRQHEGIRCHVSRPLSPLDRTVIDAIPVASLERTMLDYAEVSLQRQLIGALEEAQRRNLLSSDRFEAMFDRHNGRRGIKRLKTALAQVDGDDAPWTQSHLERAFHELVVAHGLPLPQFNVLVDGELVDAVWPDQRLIVEVDGYGYHRSRRQFEADRRRDTRLQLAGWRVVRVTAERIVNEAAAVARDIRALLGA